MAPAEETWSSRRENNFNVSKATVCQICFCTTFNFLEHCAVPLLIDMYSIHTFSLGVNRREHFIITHTRNGLDMHSRLLLKLSFFLGLKLKKMRAKILSILGFCKPCVVQTQMLKKIAKVLQQFFVCYKNIW